MGTMVAATANSCGRCAAPTNRWSRRAARFCLEHLADVETAIFERSLLTSML